MATTRKPTQYHMKIVKALPSIIKMLNTDEAYIMLCLVSYYQDTAFVRTKDKDGQLHDNLKWHTTIKELAANSRKKKETIAQALKTLNTKGLINFKSVQKKGLEIWSSII